MSGKIFVAVKSKDGISRDALLQKYQDWAKPRVKQQQRKLHYEQ